jgi:hypothetical protein
MTGVELPDECYEPVLEGTPTGRRFEPCSDFAFSSDGKFLGFFFGPTGCGRRISIMEPSTGRAVFHSAFEDGLGFEFLANGKILITTGHCEGGQVNLLDPVTGDFSVLGEHGFKYLWNSTGTAFAVEAKPYHGYEGVVWGYNVAEDFVFLRQPEVWQLDDHPVWTLDGTHLVFLRRSLINQNGTYTFPSSRQIVRVNVATGKVTVLVEDPEFDFNLCAGSDSSCDIWYGDWIQVRKFPFEPREIRYSIGEETIDEICIVAGMKCAQEPVLFALNWRTGELIPWENRVLPTPIPTIAPTKGAESG